jgi:hypothetical protein
MANTVLLEGFTYIQKLKNRNFKYINAGGNMYVDTIGSLFYLTTTTFHFLIYYINMTHSTNSIYAR